MSREDDIMERVQAEEAYAVANSNNNSPEHVSDRFRAQYGDGRWPIPVTPQVQNQICGRLFFVGKTAQACSRGGIIVRCRDDGDDSIAEYHAEINGRNGIVITTRFVQ